MNISEATELLNALVNVHKLNLVMSLDQHRKIEKLLTKTLDVLEKVI